MGVKIYLSDPSRGIFWVFQVGRGHSKTEVGGGAGFPTLKTKFGCKIDFLKIHFSTGGGEGSFTQLNFQFLLAFGKKY